MTAVLDGEPAPQKRVVRIVDGRPVRRDSRKAVDRIFAGTSLPDAALDKIARRGVLSRGKRGVSCFPSGRKGRIHFLAYGCVREDLRHGVVRLWRNNAMFGDWTGTSSTEVRATVLTAVSLTVSIDSWELHRIAREHPDLFVALGQMSAKRLRGAETVYGTSRLSPRARVAALLLYLSEDDGQFLGTDGVWHPIGDGVHGYVEGPSQADIAAALGLGLASVEKALASLRDCGVLEKGIPGATRTNRLYKIADHMALERVAHEG